MDNNTLFIEKLRSSGLRPTKQRIEICKLLFDRKKTFHFTINDISKKLSENTNKKILNIKNLVILLTYFLFFFFIFVSFWNIIVCTKIAKVSTS